jgi:ferrous iron transport protein A
MRQRVNLCSQAGNPGLVGGRPFGHHFAGISARPLESFAGNHSGCSCCPLDQVRAGMTVRIRRLGADPGVSQRLREIGLGEGQLVRLIAKSSSLICQVCNSRLALSSAVAAQILVEPVVPARIV